MSSQEDINPDSSPDTPPNRNSKDAFFEPKPQAKIIRVLTVMAYVLSVSMTAILLSIYYIFMWDGGPSIGARVGVDFGANNFSSETVKIQLNPNYNSRADPLLNSFYFTKINRSSSMLDRLSEDPKGKNETIFSYSIPSEENSTYEASTGDSQQWKSASLLDTAVKLAGEEAKDRLYEPKHKKKLVRVLTVVAYVFFVSLAAIMLSLYYVFLWNGDQKIAAKYVTNTPRQQKFYGQNCDNILAEMQQQFTAVEFEQLRAYSTPPTMTDENSTFPNDYESLEDLGTIEDMSKNSPFIKKLMGSNEEDY